MTNTTPSTARGGATAKKVARTAAHGKLVSKATGPTAKKAVAEAAGQTRGKSAVKVAVKKVDAQPSTGAAQPAAVAKPKLVRDSFTIPKGEYAQLDALKLRAAKLARPTKKSELLRAGIAALVAMPDRALLAALSAVPSLKTGRPSNKAKHGK